MDKIKVFNVQIVDLRDWTGWGEEEPEREEKQMKQASNRENTVGFESRLGAMMYGAEVPAT